MLGLTLVGFFLRATWVDAMSVQGDEAFTILFSLPPPPQLLFDVAAVEPNPPLMYVMFHYWMRLAGPTGFSVRYVSVIFGTLAIVLIYQLGRRLLAPPGASPEAQARGRMLGVAAALLLAVNQFEVHQSETVRNYTLWPALSMASLIFLLNALRTDRRRDWAAYAVAALLSLLTHYVDAFLVVFQNLYIALFWFLPGRAVGNVEGEAVSAEGSSRRLAFASPRLRLLSRWVPIQLGLLAVYIPWLLFAQKRLREYDPIGDNPAPLVMVQRLLSTLVAGPATPDDVLRWLVPLAGLLVVWGLVRLYRRDREALKFVSLYLLVPSAIVFVLGQLRGYFVDRYLTGTLPAYLLIIAYGLIPFTAEAQGSQREYSRSSLRSLRLRGEFVASIALFAVLVWGSAQSLRVYVTDPGVSAANDWRGLVRYLLRVGQPGDFIVQDYPDPTFRYYYDLLGKGRVPWTVLPPNSPPKAEETDPLLREVVQTHRRVWLLTHRSPFWDPKGYVESWLNRETTRLRKEKIAGFDVALYQTGPTSGPSVALAAPWRLVDTIELTGYDVSVDGVPALDPGPVRVHPGSLVEVTFHWRANGKPDANYTVFVHVEDGKAAVVAQHDSQPDNNHSRTTRWKPGEVVRDPHIMEISTHVPAGRYFLLAGMYDTKTLERLPTTGPGGDLPMDRAVHLGEIEIVAGP